MDSPEALPPLQSAALATYDATDGVQAARDEIATIASWAEAELDSLFERTRGYPYDPRGILEFRGLAAEASEDSSAYSVHILVGWLRRHAEVQLTMAAAKSEACGGFLARARLLGTMGSREWRARMLLTAHDWERLILEARARIAFALELVTHVNALLAHCRAAYLTDLEPIAMPDQTSLQEPVEDLVLLAETLLSD